MASLLQIRDFLSKLYRQRRYPASAAQLLKRVC